MIYSILTFNITVDFVKKKRKLLNKKLLNCLRIMYNLDLYQTKSVCPIPRPNKDCFVHISNPRTPF